MVFEKAWRFLKASRQTELGEFHPDFPSSYGPVTMQRSHPTAEFFENNEMERMLNEGVTASRNNPPTPMPVSMQQPAEQVFRQGLKPEPLSDYSRSWEDYFRERADTGDMPHAKLFDFDKPGNWFSPIRRQNLMADFPYRARVGVRMPIKEVQGEFRNKGWGREGPEAWVTQNIPPERLVRIPDDWGFWNSQPGKRTQKVVEQHPNDFGQRGEMMGQ